MKYQDIVTAWNKQADGYNQWYNLSEEEKVEFANTVTPDRIETGADIKTLSRHSGLSEESLIKLKYNELDRIEHLVNNSINLINATAILMSIDRTRRYFEKDGYHDLLEKVDQFLESV